jgi:hypothetical protein
MKKKTKKEIQRDDGQLLLTVTDKRQTRLLVREGQQRPTKRRSKIQTELISGLKSQGGFNAKTYWRQS